MLALKRRKLLHHVDGAVDSIGMILDSDLLTTNEISQLGEIQELLCGVAVKCYTLVQEIEARKHTPGMPIERTYNGPTFTWSQHEERAKAKKKIEKLRALEAKIMRLQSEIDDEDE